MHRCAQAHIDQLTEKHAAQSVNKANQKDAMKNLACEGDATSHGGKILTGADRITVKGRRAARIGDRVSCPIHGENRIVGGSSRMSDGATPLSCDGDHTECGAVLLATSDAAKVR